MKARIKGTLITTNRATGNIQDLKQALAHHGRVKYWNEIERWRELAAQFGFADTVGAAEALLDDDGQPTDPEHFRRLMDTVKQGAVEGHQEQSVIPEALVGIKYRGTQKKTAQQPRNPLLYEMVEKLAKRPRLEWKARDLWPELISMLDEAGADPVETGNKQQSATWKLTYTPEKGGDRSLTFGTFENLISAERNK